MYKEQKHNNIVLFVVSILVLAVFISCNSTIPGGGGGSTIPTWAKNYSPYGNYPAIHPTKDGNMIVAGWNYADFSTGSLRICISIAKIDNSGTIIWQKGIKPVENFGIIQDQFDIVDVRETGSGEFILAFNYEVVSWQKYKLAIAKVSASGGLLWSRSYEYPDDASRFILGGIAVDENSGKIMVVGINETLPGDDLPDYVWLMQTDANGDITWKKKIQGLYSSYPYKLIEAASDGGCVITGAVGTNPGPDINGSIPCIMKFDAAGNLSWQKTYGASGGVDNVQYGYNYESFKAIDQSPNGGYVVSGYANSVLKLDANGNCVLAVALSEVTNSTKLLNSDYSIWGQSIIALSDGSIMIMGNSKRFSQYMLPAIYPLFYTIDYETHLYSPWLIKLDSNGKISWQKIYEDDTKNREYKSDDYWITNLTQNSLQFSSSCSLSDGGFAITGTMRLPATDVSSVSFGFVLLKVDSAGIIADTALKVSNASSEIKTYGVIVKDANCTIEDYTITTNPFSVNAVNTSLISTDI
jgi:hypothetical protein